MLCVMKGMALVIEIGRSLMERKSHVISDWLLAGTFFLHEPDLVTNSQQFGRMKVMWLGFVGVKV